MDSIFSRALSNPLLWARVTVSKTLWNISIPLCYISLRFGNFKRAWQLASIAARFLYSKEQYSRCLENLNLVCGKVSATQLTQHGRIQSLLLANRELAVVEGNRDIHRYVFKMIYPHARLDDPKGLESLLLSTPCLVALTHTGDHFASISILAKSLIGSGRKLIVPIARMTDKLKTSIEALAQVTGTDVECVSVDRRGLHRLIQRAKDTSYQIAVFYDLSPQGDTGIYDHVQPCMFLGRPGYMATGVWRMAARMKRPVIFAGGSLSAAGYCLHLYERHDRASDEKATFSRAVVIAERHLQRYPESWLYLGSLENYYHTPISKKNAELESLRTAMQDLLRRWHPSSLGH